ncbi:molybdopterin synthase catalytic subunit MoaE [Aestuariicella hydrocarbonica]|uniref:Molybdopterin synthase catalytic subunit n=1 Tax=Pseudomaricurvus hydrocarbonicus TaxID=1470433 RepID=A0A9E5JTS0_9GAMM|nr:molybdopterin synthase catalytic subunit MoaE [Aestuariicella hydrocarbonica]NHO65149.1 molybdopterin synthase catalytic subunit MoaE [Aestuariicella hydrocarbonica]
MIVVQEQDFDLQHEYAALRQDCPSIGAIVTFVGLMRDFNDGDNVKSLFLEHYAGMTENVLADIVEKAKSRWNLQAVRIIHRVGNLLPSDQIVFVGVSSAHRGDAFSACEFIMDFLKTQAPFWKREQTEQGGRWVDARRSDEDSAQRWEK